MALTNAETKNYILPLAYISHLQNFRCTFFLSWAYAGRHDFSGGLVKITDTSRIPLPITMGCIWGSSVCKEIKGPSKAEVTTMV